jgi:hypothetical protein
MGVVVSACKLAIAPNCTPIASPLILMHNLFRRIAMEQWHTHAIQLKSESVDRLGETSAGRAEIFALPELFVGQITYFAGD